VVTILFWNLAKKVNVLSHLACLGKKHFVDVFVLAECPRNINPTLLQLNGLKIGSYREAVNAKAKIRALTRLNRNAFVHRFSSIGREMAVWAIDAPKLTPNQALIGGIHLMSKAGGSKDTDQASVAGEVMAELRDLEDHHGHRNTVLVGDFNMHPYDPGMTSVTGIHGLMTSKLAQLPDRIHRKKARRRFYNPMWGLFGDRTNGPAGSHYWRATVLHNPYWEMLDQVLLRPELIKTLRSLCILDHDGDHSLVAADGAPDKKYLSDHLPILCQLDL
jgi:hypothetical protein